CDLFLTNPDTLHCFFLRDFRKNVPVQAVLRNLRFVILDEAHVYTGRFGAHVSCVLRRLRRAMGICRDIKKNAVVGFGGQPPGRQGKGAPKGKAKAKAAMKTAMKKAASGPIVRLNQISAPGGSATSFGAVLPDGTTPNGAAAVPAPSPQDGEDKNKDATTKADAEKVEPEEPCRFIACSATMVRPLEFFHELADLDVKVISASGAGRGSKHVCLWTPTARARQYEIYEPDPEKRRQKMTKQKAERGIQKITAGGKNKAGGGGSVSASSATPATTSFLTRPSLRQTTLEEFGVKVENPGNDHHHDCSDLHEHAAPQNPNVDDDEQDVDSFHHMNDGIYDDIAWSFVQAVKKGIKTVLFVSARSLVELMLDRICDRIRKDASLTGSAAEFFDWEGVPSSSSGVAELEVQESSTQRVRNMRSPDNAGRNRGKGSRKNAGGVGTTSSTINLASPSPSSTSGTQQFKPATRRSGIAAASAKKRIRETVADKVISSTTPASSKTKTTPEVSIKIKDEGRETFIAVDGEQGDQDSILDLPARSGSSSFSTAGIDMHRTAGSAADALIRRIASYRAGYSKETRREVEREFFTGKLIGLVATNALELGIDVGDLQCTIHLGIPRQLSSLWQQMGRGGRGYETDSMAIVIALPLSGVDTYYMQHPEEFFERRDPVCALFVPPDVTRDHLFCAMSEYPASRDDYLRWFWTQKSFRGKKAPEIKITSNVETEGQQDKQQADETGNNPTSTSAKAAVSTSENPSAGLTPLVSLEDIQREFPFRFYHDARNNILEYCAPPKEKNAHSRFNIREIEIQYQVWDADDYSATATPLDTLEESVAYVKLFRGAVYRIRKETFIVEDLDITNQWAVVRKQIGEPLKYYTRAKDRVEIIIHSAMREVLAENNILTAGAAAGTSGAAGARDPQLRPQELSSPEQQKEPAQQENIAKQPTSYVRIFDQLHQLFRGPLTTFLYVTGYHKLNKADGQIEDTIDLKMAPLKRYHTAIWLDLGFLGQMHVAGLHALEHVMCLLAPVFGVTDSLKAQHSRGGTNTSSSKGAKASGKGVGKIDASGLPAGAADGSDHAGKLLLYPYSRTLAENFAVLVECAAERIFTCECLKGCP
ncbi:unnamed protein product, partial [Amoebophrya sp. A25]